MSSLRSLNPRKETNGVSMESREADPDLRGTAERCPRNAAFALKERDHLRERRPHSIPALCEAGSQHPDGPQDMISQTLEAIPCTGSPKTAVASRRLRHGLTSLTNERTDDGV